MVPVPQTGNCDREPYPRRERWQPGSQRPSGYTPTGLTTGPHGTLPAACHQLGPAGDRAGTARTGLEQTGAARRSLPPPPPHPTTAPPFVPPLEGPFVFLALKTSGPSRPTSSPSNRPALPLGLPATLGGWGSHLHLPARPWERREPTPSRHSRPQCVFIPRSWVTPNRSPAPPTPGARKA